MEETCVCIARGRAQVHAVSGSVGSPRAPSAGAPAGSRLPHRLHSCAAPRAPGLAHRMCGFTMVKPQASSNPLFRFPALCVGLSSFVYFLKIFPFGLCFLAWPSYGFCKCNLLRTPLLFVTPRPRVMASSWGDLHVPRLWRALGPTGPPPLHLKGEDSWGTLLCKAWLSFTCGPSDLPKPKKSHVLIFQSGFLTIDISRTAFLKLQVSWPHLWGSVTGKAFSKEARQTEEFSMAAPRQPQAFFT